MYIAFFFLMGTMCVGLHMILVRVMPLIGNVMILMIRITINKLVSGRMYENDMTIKPLDYIVNA